MKHKKNKQTKRKKEREDDDEVLRQTKLQKLNKRKRT